MKIKDAITENNWCQGVGVVMGDVPVVKRCLSRWIGDFYFQNDTIHNREIYKNILNRIKQELGTDQIHIWNDSYLTTFKDVKALVNKLDI